jgi:hypothetical protein
VRAGCLELAGTQIPVPGPDGPATFAIRPEHVEVAPRAALVATVVEALFAGTHVRLVAMAGEQRIEVHTTVDQLPPVGSTTGIELPIRRLWRVPATSAETARGEPERHADPS